MAKSTPNSEIGGGSSASGGGGRGRLSVSVRSGEVDPGTNRMVKAQNKSAESYKVKDLDAMEKNKIQYQKQKEQRAAQLEGSYKAGKLEGKIKGGAAGLAAGIAADELARAAAKKKEKQGTQAGHAVTDNNNHTKPVSPAKKQAEAKRPAVGTDADAKKKYGSKTWNNGYTN